MHNQSLLGIAATDSKLLGMCFGSPVTKVIFSLQQGPDSKAQELGMEGKMRLSFTCLTSEY